jgi:hypothetical protein
MFSLLLWKCPSPTRFVDWRSSVAHVNPETWSDTIVLPGLGAEQPKCFAPRGDLFAGRDFVTCGQLVACIHNGQYVVPLLDSSDDGHHQATSVWNYHFHWHYCGAQCCEDVELDDT